MSRYETILIAIDVHGSPDQVLAKAANIVGNQTSAIHVLTVSPDPAHLYMTYPILASSAPDFDWEGQRQDTLAQMKKLTEHAGLSHSNVIAMTGSATSMIVDQAKQLAADLIIVGSHGRRGVSLLLGSTANGVLHRAKCDVLAVRITDSAKQD